MPDGKVILTRADLMRAFKNGAQVKLLRRYGEPVMELDPKFGGWRSVKKVQSNGVYFSSPNGRNSWLETTPASLIEFYTDGSGHYYLNCYDPGFRPVTPAEKQALEYTNNMEYWTARRWLEGNGFKHLVSGNIGSECVDYTRTRIKSKRIKGELVLQYKVRLKDKLK